MVEQIPDLSNLAGIEVKATDEDGLHERVARRRRRRRGRTSAGIAVLACAALAVGVIGTSGGGSFSPESVEAATRVTLPGGAVDTDLSGGRLWVLTCQARCPKADPRAKLVEISSADGRIEQTLEVGGAASVAAGAGSAWVANFATSSVERIEPESGEVIATIQLTLPEPVAGDDARLLPTELAFGEGSLWVSGGRGYAARIDPATDTVVAMYKIPANPGQLVVAAGHAWIGGGVEGLVEIDPSDGKVSVTSIEGAEGRRLNVTGLAEVGGQLWATGGWAAPTTEAGGHPAYVLTSESALVEVGAAGAESPPVGIPELLTVFGGRHGRPLLARTPRAGVIYELPREGRRLSVVTRLQKAGTPLEVRADELWIGVGNRGLDLYRLGSAATDRP